MWGKKMKCNSVLNQIQYQIGPVLGYVKYVAEFISHKRNSIRWSDDDLELTFQ